MLISYKTSALSGSTAARLGVPGRLAKEDELFTVVKLCSGDKMIASPLGSILSGVVDRARVRASSHLHTQNTLVTNA
jgi:hypothetical protein